MASGGFYPDIPGRRMVLHEAIRGDLAAASGTRQLNWRWRTRDKISLTALHGFFTTAAAGTSTTKFTLKIWAGAIAKGNATAAPSPGAGKTAMTLSMGAVTIPANTWVSYAVHTVGGGTAGGGIKLASFYNHGWNS